MHWYHLKLHPLNYSSIWMCVHVYTHSFYMNTLSGIVQFTFTLIFSYNGNFSDKSDSPHYIHWSQVGFFLRENILWLEQNLRPKFSYRVFLLPSQDWYKRLILQWHINGRDGVSNHQPPHCILNLLFRSTSKKTPKLRFIGWWIPRTKDQ